MKSPGKVLVFLLADGVQTLCLVLLFPDILSLLFQLLGWLSEKLPDAKKLPSMEMGLCVPAILTSMEDRNGAVRQKAQEALVPFMIHTGYDAFLKAAGKLKVSIVAICSYYYLT